MDPNHSISDRNELLALDDSALLRRCHQACFRASGPGGQHRNTTDSAVRLSVLEGRVVVLCVDHRSQHRNRAEALRRLRSAIAIELRAPLSGDDTGSQHWQGSWKLGKKDRRYAGFIAHILDVLSHHNWAVGLAADALGISTGKLVRVLAQDTHLWNAANKARAGLNLVHLRQP